jgi:putative PIN family toxin of toxin-antitoxin system
MHHTLFRPVTPQAAFTRLPCPSRGDRLCSVTRNATGYVVYVFDTNVLVSAFLSTRGASHRILAGLVAGRIPLMATPALVFEYEAVLKRPFVKAGWATDEDIDAVLDVLCLRMTRVERYIRWRPMLRDPGDDLVLECATNGMAHAIVTMNERDFVPEAHRFGIDVVGPGRFLHSLQQQRRP